MKKPPDKESAARTILRRFLAPFSRFKHKDQDMGQHWEQLFGSSVREIRTFRAKRALTLPGLFYVSGSVTIQGIGPRDVNKDELLYVRINHETGNADVEHSVRNQENVFALTSSEWGALRLKLEPVRLKTEKRKS